MEQIILKCPYCKIKSDLDKFLALPENAELAGIIPHRRSEMERMFLRSLLATLTEYQRQRGEPSASIARVVLAVEKELQHIHFCPACGGEKGDH